MVLVKQGFNVTDMIDAETVSVVSKEMGHTDIYMMKDSEGSNRRRLIVILNSFYVVKVKANAESNYTIAILETDKR
jgi:hypothetical protein